MTRSRFSANVARSAQGQLTTGPQLQPEEAEPSPGHLHRQCWRLLRWKFSASFPGREGAGGGQEALRDQTGGGGTSSYVHLLKTKDVEPRGLP